MTGKWNLRGIVAALVMLALVCVPVAGKALAADLELDDQQGQLGNRVTFTVSVNNAPNQVAALGFEVTYDPDVLTYVEYAKGALVQDFDFFDVNLVEPGLVRIGGFEAGDHKIAEGTSGPLVTLTFDVKGTADDTLTLTALKDHINTWTTKVGTFTYLLPTIESVSPEKGPTTGGQSITITGANFFVYQDTVPTVTLGGQSATDVSVDSATQITCKTPAHDKGTVDVVVTNPDSKSATLQGGYEYVEFAIDPSSKTLKVGESQEFTVVPEGIGTPPFTWKVNDDTKQTGDSRTYTFTATAAGDYTITVEDSSTPALSATANVNVYEDVVIPETPEAYDPEKPDTFPIVESGGSYDFTVTGGEGSSYTWTVDGPVDVAGGDGAEFTFDAPTEGPFAGVYTVTVTDELSTFTKSIKVKVPMTFTPNSKNMQGEPAEPVAAAPNQAYTFVVAGARPNTPASIALVTKDKEEIEEQADYGAPTIDDTFGADATAKVSFDPAAVQEVKSFLFKVTATDTDLEDAGLSTLYSGTMRIIPRTCFKGVIQNEGGSPIQGADIRVMLEGVVKAEATSAADGTFEFTIVNPSTIGAEYTVIVNKDEYVTETTTTEDWQNPKIITMGLAAEGASLTGTVKDYVGTPIAGARILAEVDEETIEAYSDAAGSYTLNLPVALPEQLMARATKDGHLADSHDVIADANFVLIQTTAITTETTKVGDDVKIKITADPAFSGDTAEISTKNDDTDVSAVWDDTDKSWTCTMSADTDFTLDIQADTTEDKKAETGYFASASVTWVADEAQAEEAKIQPVHDEAGGLVEAGDVKVDVPAGALDADDPDNPDVRVKITPDIDVGTPTAETYTDKSTVLVSVDIEGATLAEPIRITVPFDTDEVAPGDFKAGKAVIYHAPTADDLRKGKNVTAVPATDILYQDDINGLVTFQVSSLSVFAIGSPAASPTPSPGAESGDDDDNCFIATAAYGSPFEKHVETLRHFRDVYLMPTKVGQAFVRAYYRFSPPVAHFIADHDTLRAAVRVGLMPVVGMSYVALHTTLAQKILILVLMVGLVVATYTGTRKMRATRHK